MADLFFPSLFCRFGRKPVSTILVFPSMGGCLFHRHGSLRIQLPSPGDLGVSGYSIPRHTSSWFCFAGFSIPGICFSLVAPSFLMCLDSVSPCRFLVSFRVVCVQRSRFGFVYLRYVFLGCGCYGQFKVWGTSDSWASGMAASSS